MDNILKLLLGVLAISGLIALLIPSGTTIAPAVEIAPQEVAGAVPVPQPVAPPEGTDDAPEDDDEYLDGQGTDDEDFIIGEPSIDGQPFGAGSYTPPTGSNAPGNQVNNPAQEDTPAGPSPNNETGY